MRNVQTDDLVQVCVHIASASNDLDLEEHWWDVPDRAWIVLCDRCHGHYQRRQSVEIHGELFRVPDGVRLDPATSCAVHAKPASERWRSLAASPREAGSLPRPVPTGRAPAGVPPLLPSAELLDGPSLSPSNQPRAILVRATISNFSNYELGKFIKDYYAGLDEEVLGQHMRNGLTAATDQEIERWEDEHRALTGLAEKRRQLRELLSQATGPCSSKN